MSRIDNTGECEKIICETLLQIGARSRMQILLSVSGLLITAFVLLAMPCMASPAMDDASGRPVIHLFEASPNMVGLGANATLKWDVSRADTLFINPGGIRLDLGKSPSGIAGINGSLIVHPIITTNYTLTAENAIGNSTANTSVIVNTTNIANKSLEISIDKDMNQPVISHFQALPSKIMAGESSTLSWSVSNAAEVTISGLGKVALTGSMAIMPISTTTYVLEARNAGKVAAAHTAITVEKPIPSKPVINSFYADQRSIKEGQSTALHWSVSGASNIAIDKTGPVPPTGSSLIRPSSTTAYTLTASNSAGIVVAITQVSVAPRPYPPVIKYFSASKRVISRGDSTALSWSVSGASRVDINGRRVSSSGSLSVSPSYSTAYTLSACNDGGCVSDSAYIEVGEVAIQPINIMPEPDPGMNIPIQSI